MWDGTDAEIPVGILFMTVKGAHASLPPRAVPLLWPRESASNPELSQDRIRALRAWTQTLIPAAYYFSRSFDWTHACVMLCAWRCMRAING